MIVQNTAGMLEYLKRIKISTTEYKIVGDKININLNHQQILYRQNGDPQLGTTMKNSKEYAEIFNKIFTL
jgi:hypothetical protein